MEWNADMIFRQYLVYELRMTIVDVPGDGNCMYSAISEGIYGSSFYQRRVRDEVYNFMYYNRQVFMHLTDAQFLQKLSEVQWDGIWGTHEVLVAATMIYRRNIVVHEPPNRRIFIQDEGLYEPAIHLSYHNQCHYNFLRPPLAAPYVRNVLNTNQALVQENSAINLHGNWHQTPESTYQQGNYHQTPQSSNLQENCHPESPYQQGNYHQTPQSTNLQENCHETPKSTYQDGAEGLQGSTSQDEWVMDEDVALLGGPKFIEHDWSPEVYSNVVDDHSPNVNINEPQSTQNSDVGIKPLVERKGFAFLSTNVYKGGRSQAVVILLIRKKYIRNTLMETISVAKGEDLYFTVDYTGSVLKEIRTDADMREMFGIFTDTCWIPWETEFLQRSVWLCNLLIPPVILSTLGYTFSGMRLKMFYKQSSNSLPVVLLNAAWMEMRDGILRDIAEILKKKDSYFCVGCNSDCIFKLKPWHHDIINFKKVSFLPPSTVGFMQGYNFLGPVPETAPIVLYNLWMIETTFGCNTIENVTLALNDNAQRLSSNYYHVYLVLILDGVNMKDYEASNVEQLLQKNDVAKFVYVGFSTNEEIRSTHFSNDTAINRVLTKYSQMFFIRKATFRNPFEALTEEAFNIELLKVYLGYQRQNKLPFPFILLNRKSESGRLTQLSHLDVLNILDFCDSGLPVFSPTLGPSSSQSNVRFSGLYSLHEKVDMLPGAYQKRNFENVKKDLQGFGSCYH